MAKAKKEKPTTQKRTKLDIDTHIPLPGGQSLFAHITGPAQGIAGKLSVVWEVRKGGECIHRASKSCTHKYDPKKEAWDTAIRIMRNKAITAYCALKVEEKGKPSDTPTSRIGYSKAFEEHIDELRKPTWGNRTWDLYRPTVRKICLKLDNLDVIDVTSIEMMINDQIEETASRKLSKGRKSAQKTVEHLMVAADYCLAFLCEICNEKAGGVILQPVPIWEALGRTKHYQLETAKWIAKDILVKLAECLFRFCRIA